MTNPFAGVRLLGPPVADGEYIALSEHETVHLHEYTRIYAVPGLYEHVVQERLRCRSPQVAAEGLLRAAARLGLEPASMTVLDVGSGTGLVGELLRRDGVARVVGVDALPAAREACLRDRPGLYDDYVVGDFEQLGDGLGAALRPYAFGGLVSAGAFGGTHATPRALVNALGLLPSGAPVAFTLHEQWMDEADPDGFGAAVGRLVADGRLELLERTRFQHRVTTTGEPIFYWLVAGRTGCGGRRRAGAGHPRCPAPAPNRASPTGTSSAPGGPATAGAPRRGRRRSSASGPRRRARPAGSPG